MFAPCSIKAFLKAKPQITNITIPQTPPAVVRSDLANLNSYLYLRLTYSLSSGMLHHNRSATISLHVATKPQSIRLFCSLHGSGAPLVTCQSLTAPNPRVSVPKSAARHIVMVEPTCSSFCSASAIHTQYT